MPDRQSVISVRGWKGGGPVMQCHLLAMVLAVTQARGAKSTAFIAVLAHTELMLLPMTPKFQKDKLLSVRSDSLSRF